MPTYQYACTECGHSFEQFQSFSEDSLTVCPVCDGKLRKLFNAVGVVFKGSGFYRNDSRDSSAKASTSSTPAASSSSSSDSSSSSSSTTSSSSTPAAASSSSSSTSSSSSD